MNGFSRIISSILAMIMLLSSSECQHAPVAAVPESYEAVYENLGIPLQSRYPSGQTARTAWDVEVYDGKVFVASGDYNENAGPIDIMYYDLDEGIWVHSGTVPDEQIERFVIINGTLMAPGIDPKDHWDLGNIYIYREGQWISKRNIPGGIHQFDMVEHEDMIFVGLGVGSGAYPIAVSSDVGETFQQVPLYKNGAPVDTAVPADETGAAPDRILRGYDFFTLDGALYTFVSQNLSGEACWELYKYEDGVFAYYSDLPQRLYYNRISFALFTAKAEYKGKVFFSTGALYVTDDLVDAQKLTLGSNEIVSDLRIIDGRLYASAVTKMEDGTYRTSIWVNSIGKTDVFREVFFFYFSCPAQSFTYENGIFYFGMGEGVLSEFHEANGTVLAVKHQLQ